MANVSADKVRNVGILGHGGTGKTMLIEHVLHMVGKTSRLGSISDGNTIGDYLEEEIQRQQTIAMKLMNLEWKGTRIHLVDHPGYADFLGEVAASVPLLDGLVIVVDSTTGIQVGTDNAWSYAEMYKTPRAIFVNKLDREHTDFFETVALLQKTYGNQCVPLVIPVGASSKMTAVANVLTDENAEVADQIEEIRASLVDVVAESDDTLLEKYLESGTLSPEEFNQGLQRGIESGKIVPIVAGSVEKELGVGALLDLIANSFPSPLKRSFSVVDPAGVETAVEISPDAPFIGQVFRSVVDPYVGQLTLFRVVTGTLRADSDFYNSSTHAKERTGKIFFLCGKEQTQVAQVGPGDLAAMAKLKNTHFGDTLTVAGSELTLARHPLPESMVKLAIFPKSRADEDKIGEALNRLAEEDPTFTHYRDTATNEHVVRGMGDLQLDILLDRMKRKFGVEAETQTPKVAYRETIRGKAEGQGKHKKQTGGHGQYGDVHIRVAPLERGSGYQFVDAIVGGVVPRQYIPHVDKGCQETLLRGVIAGYPMSDLAVELFYGSYHEVDSSEMSFKLAARKAINTVVPQAEPCLLEPIMEISVTVPEEYMGDITGDLNSRRGRIIGMDSAGPGRQSIRANVPEAEVLRYSTDLRSMTGGRGSYKLKFSHYDQVPEYIAQGLIQAYQKSRTASED